MIHLVLPLAIFAADLLFLILVRRSQEDRDDDDGRPVLTTHVP